MLRNVENGWLPPRTTRTNGQHANQVCPTALVSRALTRAFELSWVATFEARCRPRHDPMTRVKAFRELVRRTHGMSQVFARSVWHGGHGAMWIVQPAATLPVFERFFE